MTTPTQHPASTSDARKRAADLATPDWGSDLRPVRTDAAYAECHCVVADGRWRRQADHCPQHVDGETWRDA